MGTFKRSKNVWTDEQEALADVLQKESEKGITADQLETFHTSSHFVWKTKEVNSESKEKPNSFSYAKNEFTEAEAIATAMNDLDTFEGNLKPDHDEEYFVYSKVRQ